MATESFRRARTPEQRDARRDRILAVTRNLLRERRVADVSLNEIARQVGLAKSNVLRYFGSREAILLVLTEREYAGWVAELEGQGGDGGACGAAGDGDEGVGGGDADGDGGACGDAAAYGDDAACGAAGDGGACGAAGGATSPDGGGAEGATAGTGDARDPDALTSSDARVRDLAAELARTVTRRPLLCELLGCTTAVLEHNVGVDEVLDFKLAIYGHMERLARLVESRLGPLDDHGVLLLALHAVIAEVWAFGHPAPTLVEAAARDARVRRPPADLVPTMARALSLVLRGARKAQ